MTVVDKPLTGAENITWDLGDLYASPNDPQLEADRQTSLEQAQAFAEKYRGRIAELSAAEMREAVETMENIYTYLVRAGSYAYMIWSTETQNAELGKLVATTNEHGAAIQQELVFFEVELAALSDEAAQTLMDDPAIGKYKHYLILQRLNAPYTRSEAEEKVISQLSLTGANAWGRYFGEVFSNTRYPWEDEQITQAEILSKIRDTDREVRHKAADVVTDVLHETSHASAFTFNMMLQEKQSLDKIRGYKTWISSRNIANQVDDDTVEALIEAVTSRYDIVHRYYNALKKVLGYDALYDYDRYTPVEKSKRQIPWEEAQKIVTESFGRFSPQAADVLNQFFDKRWIDAPIKAGKRMGAYSASTTATVHPYVFMNYDGTLDSVFTLAHELGHGLHQFLAREQGEFLSDTPLTTAEMASTFGEMLTFDLVIADIDDPYERLALRMNRAADTFATVFRQVSMNRFENAIHTARRSGGELSKEQLSEFWMETQRPMFGDSLTLRDEYSIWWSYIPHFINVPGYVYAYAFGELLVWALYARYQQENSADFATRYLKVLSSGGNDWPHNILSPMGVNLQDPQFWHEGLNLMDNFVKEIESDVAKL